MDPNFVKSFDVDAEGAFKAYKRLIEETRRQLADTFSHNVPILPPRQGGRLPFFHVELRTNTYVVTLWIRADDVYMVGYRVGDAGAWFEMPEHPNSPSPHLIAGSTFLSFGAGYSEVAHAAHRGREDTPLGRGPLANAVDQLATATSIRHDGEENRARAVIVVAQMICESIRFRRISDHLAESFREYNPPPPPSPAPTWMLNLENGWSDLSGAVRRAEGDPMIPPNQILPPNDMGIQTLAGAREVLGIMLGTMEFSGELRRVRRMAVAGQPSQAQGRPLVEVFSVCINDIDGEDPGDLYGTIKVTDGLHCQYIYNRGREDYELIRRRGTALLTGPSYAISAEGSFTIDLALSDRAVLPPDDPISTGLISWNVYHTTNVYDKLLSDEVGGRYGSVTVNYLVLSDAAEATVEVTLINGDGQSAADVYGLLTARNAKFMNESVLFRKARVDAIRVAPGQLITLSRSVVAVPFNSSLIVRADLKYRDRLNFDDEIAKGTADFPVQLHSSCEKYVSGKYGKIKVTVSWN